METQLNQAKDLLETIDFQTLQKSDPYEQKIEQIKTQLSHTQHFTKAGIKLYEMFATTELGSAVLGAASVTTSGNTLKAFFNADLPGSFVFATNHMMKLYGKDLNWVIASFYPKEPNAKQDFLNDQFGILEKNPTRALVGSIHTNKGSFWSDGDLTRPGTPLRLAILARSKLGLIDFYTADGGFGVSGKENLQEKLSLDLIRGEIETGFYSLRNGGVFLLKIFTFFTPDMLQYLEVIKRSFDRFYIVKPSTSAPMNSEHYVLGIGFQKEVSLAHPKNVPSPFPTELLSVSPEILESQETFARRQIHELTNFASGIGQSIPTFDAGMVQLLDPSKRI